MAKLEKTMFREYDIRGVAGHGFTQAEIAEYEKWYGPFPGVVLTQEAAELIGKAYGTIIARGGGKKVVVGYEHRPFGRELQEAFVRGVRSTGCAVLDAEVSLTPFVYFAVAYWRFDGGVNITGSHNLYFFNGFKMMKKDVWPLFGKEIQEMRQLIEQERFETGKQSEVESLDIYGPYEAYVKSRVRIKGKPKVVIDTGNGSAGMFAPKLFGALGCEVIELYAELDARFPNHTPDPEAPQNMNDLGERVRGERADLGIAFDADGDRAGFVDEQGNFISADLPLLVFARDALSRNPGKKILYDVKCSQLLEELVPTYGGVPLMHRTGHAPIKETLRQDEDVIFGGEVSGHFFFVEDYFRIDDGLFAAAKMLELFSRTGKKFSALFADIPIRIRTPEMKLPCADEEKFKVVERMRKSLGSRFESRAIDGIRLQVSKTSWGLVRASNTSPYLTIRVEGATAQEVLGVKNILADELEKFPEVQDTLERNEVASFTGKLGWR